MNESNPPPQDQPQSEPPQMEWTPELYRLGELLRDLMYPEGSPLSEVPVLVWPKNDPPMTTELLRSRLLHQIGRFQPSSLRIQ